MKKRILLISLAFVLCLSLCSCDYLDEQKTIQFTWTDDSLSTLISRDGKEYKELPHGLDLTSSHISEAKIGYLVSSDVPLLLASSFGSTVRIFNGSIVRTSGEDFRYYCLSENYDAVSEFIKGNRGVYGCFYYSYLTYRYEFVKLTDEEKAVIDLVMSGEKGEIKQDDEIESYVYNLATVYRVDEELLLENYEYEICAKEQQGKREYYIAEYDTYGIQTIYIVPEEFYQTFNNLATKVGY